MTTFGTGNASKTNTFNNDVNIADSLIWSMGILRVRPLANTDAVWLSRAVEAMGCGLYYCVKQYSSGGENGVLLETETQINNAPRDPNSWQLDDEDLDRLDVKFYANADVIDSIEYNETTFPMSPRTDLMFGNEFNVS